jgi:hypothetical protein
MCSPAISPDFTWRLLDDFCRSDIFWSICVYSQASFMKSVIQTGLWNRSTGPCSHNSLKLRRHLSPQ